MKKQHTDVETFTNLNKLIFSKCVYLKDRTTEKQPSNANDKKEGESEKELSSADIHSPNIHNNQRRVRLKGGIANSTQCATWV